MNQPACAPSPAPSHFSHIQRRFDARLDAVVARLHPGDYYVATEGELIGTVLGSCVSACVRDSRLRIGGMNHFMLPVDRSDGSNAWGSTASASTRFGNVAMERLINEILKLGGRRADLEVKLVGGGKVLDALSDVGARNIRFVKEYVKAEGFRVVGEDLGDLYPRKVLRPGDRKRPGQAPGAQRRPRARGGNALHARHRRHSGRRRH
jgi:chemotaxis protein CheD